jgi:phytoene synthase
MDEKDNNRLFCWEQITAANPLFRVSRVFAPGGIAEKLVPLYALFSAVEQICSTVSDADVAGSKLAWWRQECVQRDLANSQHPVLKEMQRTGAADSLDRGDVIALLEGANTRLSARAPSDRDALREICIDVYRPQLQMELRLGGLAVGTEQVNTDLMARNGLLQLLRESLRRKEQDGFWWLPLNLLARHGLNRVDIANRPDSAPVRNLFAEILEDDPPFHSAADFGDTPGTDLMILRHVFALSGIYARKIGRLKNLSPARFNNELNRAGPSDLLAAWQGARKTG